MKKLLYAALQTVIAVLISNLIIILIDAYYLLALEHYWLLPVPIGFRNILLHLIGYYIGAPTYLKIYFEIAHKDLLSIFVGFIYFIPLGITLVTNIINDLWGYKIFGIIFLLYSIAHLVNAYNEWKKGLIKDM